MNPYWQLAICLVGALLSFFLGGALAALSFAVATIRFSGVSGKKYSEAKMSPAAKFCISNSSKISPIVSIGRRFVFAAATLCIYFAFDATADLVGWNLSPIQCIGIAFICTISALFVQYTFFDLPAAFFGKMHPLHTLSKVPQLFFIVYVFLAPLEIIARKIGVKLFASKKYSPLAFDYIDVIVMLRTEDSDTDSISPYTGKIVKNALKLQELDVSDVMLPRSQVVYLDTNESNQENMKLIYETKHTRYPLCKGNLDDCYGIVHIKNIFITNKTVDDSFDFRKACRQTLRLKENEKLESALAKMLKYKLQMALVEDEFGGVIGVITLDAALSELVGRIRDEFDTSQDNSIAVIGKNKYKISGLATLHRVEDFLDVDFKTDEVSTFGGLITFLLGRFPEKNERLYFKEQRMRVIIDKIQERGIEECTVLIEDSDSEPKDN